MGHQEVLHQVVLDEWQSLARSGRELWDFPCYQRGMPKNAVGILNEQEKGGDQQNNRCPAGLPQHRRVLSRRCQQNVGCMLCTVYEERVFIWGGQWVLVRWVDKCVNLHATPCASKLTRVFMRSPLGLGFSSGLQERQPLWNFAEKMVETSSYSWGPSYHSTQELNTASPKDNLFSFISAKSF